MASTAAMTAAAIRTRFLPAGGTMACEPLLELGEDATDSAKTMSLADWNLSFWFFSRQCRTMRSRAGEMFLPEPDSSGGSSRRIAAIVSLAVFCRNALLPESSS